MSFPKLTDYLQRYLHESQNASGMGPRGGKTPYGAGRMTPGRTPAARTPGHMSVRQPGQLPNMFGAPSAGQSSVNTPMTGTSYGGATAYGGATSYGFQTPRPGFVPPAANPGPPPGMNPQRASMIQNPSWGSWN